MYPHVTRCTLLKFRIEQVVARRLNIDALVASAGSAAIVAFQADSEHYRTFQ
jgi:hypothetical protein